MRLLALLALTTFLGCAPVAVAPTAHVPPPPAPAPPPAPVEPLPPPSATDPASGHACTGIVGLDNVALTFDGGKTLVRSRTPLREGVRMYGPVALGTPYTLAAISDAATGRYLELYLSVDGGCHWSRRGAAPANRLAEGRNGTAYAWGGGDDVLAITVGTTRHIHAPTDGLIHIESAPRDPGRLRLLGGKGVFDSKDGGSSWVRVGSPPAPGNEARVSFAALDWNHILVGSIRGRGASPVQVTHDGGVTWTRSKEDENMVQAVQLGVDGRVAWSFGDYSYRSTDGGASFARFAASGRPTSVQLLGAQPSVDLLGMVRTILFAPPSLVRLDTHLVGEKSQALPLDGGRPGGYGVSAMDNVVGGTFVPGEATAICLGVVRSPPSQPLG